MATATFQDSYFGPTQMTVASFKTTRQGAKVTRFRWMPIAASGCITTGFVPHGFSSEAMAVAAAIRNARFSNIQA